MINKNKQSPLILLSAGGTGGHVMPAQALGVDLISRGFRVEIITDQRGLKFKPHFDLNEGKTIPMHVVKAGTLGAGILGKAKGLSNLALGIMQAKGIVKRLKPAVVVGFGGYPSVPGVYAAQKRKIPTILHEQNAILGKANDLLAGKAERIALSWDDSKGLSEEEWTRAIVTGNPVRSDIANLYNQPYPQLEINGVLRILVMGGSLGASVFSEILPAALSQLPSDHRARLHIVQQCREGECEDTIKAYAKANIKADIVTFIDDVATELEACHLFIGRSGASTVCEVTAAGRPAIFVPYPHHKDQQQKINADTISDEGGAWTFIEKGFTADAVLARVETFMQDPSILFRAAEKARLCGRPDAARKLGNLVTAIASGWPEEK